MKLPQTPRHHRGKLASSGRSHLAQPGDTWRGNQVATGKPRRVRELSAALAVAALVLMGSTPAIADDTVAPPVQPPAPTEPAAQAPAPQPATAPEPAPAPAPAPAPEPSAPPESVPAPPAVAPAAEAEPPAAPAEEQAGEPVAEVAAEDPAATQLPDPPYLRWRVADSNDALVGDTSITIEGPRDETVADDGEGSQWQGALAATVEDNTGQDGYVGADLDPEAGMFLVTHLVDDLDPARTHDAAADETFRLQVHTVPDGFTIDDTVWEEFTVSTSGEDPITVLQLVSEPQARPAEEAKAGTSDLISPLALIAADCGNTSDCAGLRITNVVVGGTATAADWALKAVRNNAAVDEYVFTSGQLRTVPRNVGGSTRAVYALTATATPAVQALYDTTFACTSAEPSSNSNNTTDIDTAARSVSYGYRSNNNLGTPATRYAYCTFTQTLITPATIIVKTGSDRTGTTGVTDLAGVVLYLNTGTNAPSGTRADGVAGDAAGWARCVSSATGECTFLVPGAGTGGTNRDKQFWVVQPVTGVPTGWFTNPNLRTGGGSGDGTSSQYTFQTGSQLRAGQTYRSTSNFMYSTSDNANASGGIWQQSRVNPALTQTCGVDVALVLDLSGSVAGSVAQLRTAADTFTDALVGTPSRMALFSFSSNSPATNATQNYPTLTPVATQAQANTFKTRYASWGASGGTNWDRGLAVPAAANTGANKYEVVVVITDGNPTYYGTGPSGSGNDNRFIETENGIFSANAIKASGTTRLLAFGVGDGATGVNTGLNLRAISGPTRYNGTNGAVADYMQTSNYADVGDTLRKLALGNCAGQLTVTKMVVPNTAPVGSIAGAAPAVAGWNFTASDPGTGLTLPVPPTRTTTDDSTGTVSFPLGFAGGTASAPVTVTETQQPGYTLVPVSGQNAVCRNLSTEQSVALTGNPVNGFRVNVPSTETVNCIVYNRAPDQTSTVAVTKNWVVNDGTGGSKTYKIPGDEGLLPAGLAAQLTLTGPGAAGATNQDWGAVRANYISGTSVTINETATVDAQKLPGCTLGTKLVTNRNGVAILPGSAVPYTSALQQGANTFEVTNTVNCQTKVTLVKSLTNDNGGTSTVPNWTLTAAGPTTGVSGITGNTAVTNKMILPGNYTLSETGPSGYTAEAWTCVSAAGVVPVVDGVVAIAFGTNVTCTVNNNDKPGAVSWTKVDGVNASLLEGSEWKIVGTAPAVPAVTFTDCEVAPCSGPDKDPAAGKFELQGLSWGSYTVTETVAPPGYQGGASFTFAVNGANAGTVIVHGAVTNAQQQGVALPLTGGMSSDMFTLWGTGIALLAALMGVAYWRRFRGVVVAQ